MSKIKIYWLPLFVLGLFITEAAHGQSYVDGLLSHKVTVHYPDHTVIATAKPTDFVPVESDRLYYWFSGNQINTTQGGYSGKLLNGSYQDFYLNKNLKESGSFEKGLKTSLWKNWTDNGILKDEYSFKEGKRSGAYAKYDLSGKLLEKGFYRNDLLHGKQETIVADSSIVVYYKDGRVKIKKNILPGFIYKILPKRSAKKSKP